MKKVVHFAMISVFLLLTACAENPNSSNSNQDIVLATVPAEYAGITNPLGSELAGNGAAIYKNYCASCQLFSYVFPRTIAVGDFS